MKGDKYGASIAWLPADSEADAPSMQPGKPAPSAPSLDHSDASQLQRQSAGSSSEGSSSGAAAVNGTGQAAGSSTAAGGSGGPGQLPVSSARVASVTVQPDRFPGPTLSLQDFPQQGACCTAGLASCCTMCTK